MGSVRKKTRDKFKVGSIVTVKEKVEAYYSSYAGNPECFLMPGVRATIQRCEVPYVVGPNETFVLVELEGPEHGSTKHPYTRWNTGVDYRNLVLIE